jgi:hypothetical protein
MAFVEWEHSFEFRCDSCGLSVEFAPNDFRECVAELKLRNWRIGRDKDGEWFHKCGRCKSKEAGQVVDLLNRKLNR